MPDTLRGLGVSGGVAAGPALRMGEAPALPAPRPVADSGSELGSALDALKALAAELDERAGRAADPAARAILEAQSMIAADPMLSDSVEARVTAGADAPHALHAAFTEQAEGLRAAGGYLAERAADLEDLRDRAVARVLGLPMPGIPDPGHPYILIARDLAPADTATLDPSVVLALVTAQGGPTSHTAILSRALGLPAIVACPAALEIEDGTAIQVDGDAGTIGFGGTAQVRRPVRTVAEVTGPGSTADGHRIPLMLNIGSAAELRSEAAQYAEGVGLLRTELLFLGRHDAPTLEEQREAYAEVFRALPERKVVIRTLDAGADKPLPFLGLAEEPNPALGIRGLRVGRLLPDVLEQQLAAIASAAEGTAAQVWVMAPMVSTVPEAAEFADRVRAHGLATAGAMVEVPAAALRARRILEHVDFLSIGTNDLGQYTMAADRQCGDLADLLDPWQPALLQLIATCAEAGREAGKPVGVCGEAASDPYLALVLVGLGVTSLSMSAGALANVSALLRERTLADCVRSAEAALAADDAVQAREAVRST